MKRKKWTASLPPREPLKIEHRVLLSCPGCKQEPRLEFQTNRYRVYCEWCEMSTPLYLAKESAFSYWNNFKREKEGFF
jgi:hypothetical protein